jgi:predicted small secreted protein
MSTACLFRSNSPFHSRSALAIALLAVLAIFTLGLAGCNATPGDGQHSTVQPARPYTAQDVSLNQNTTMPSFVTAAMRDGYDYALNYPEQLQYIPCYCGCGLTAGHKSNLDCYVAGVDKNGMAIFDNHASYCTICLEITRDVKRLSAEGKSLPEIRAFVDQAHGEKGPGTDTPKPPM